MERAEDDERAETMERAEDERAKTMERAEDDERA